MLKPRMTLEGGDGVLKVMRSLGLGRVGSCEVGGNLKVSAVGNPNLLRCLVISSVGSYL